MEKVCVFIDGGYLDKVIENAGNKRVDYGKLARKLCSGNNFIRAYYYHCLPYQSNPATPDEISRFSRASAFYDRLKGLDRFQIRMGKLAKRGYYATGTPILIQKRVDVFLATDLVKFSAQRVMDHAVLLTADSDYVPAILAAKEFGPVITLAFLKHKDMPLNQELLDACDERFGFTPEYFNDILR